MRLKNLKLKNFRSYADLSLEFPPGVVVFVGDNGQGKTNLIESIYLLVRGESFRAGIADTYVKHASPNALVKATIEKNNLIDEIQWTSKLGQKRLELNGKKTSGLQLSRDFPVVLFSPESSCCGCLIRTLPLVSPAAALTVALLPSCRVVSAQRPYLLCN